MPAKAKGATVFGGHHFASAPMGHSGYFDPRNPALTTLAHIVRGEA